MEVCRTLARCASFGASEAHDMGNFSFVREGVTIAPAGFYRSVPFSSKNPLFLARWCITYMKVLGREEIETHSASETSDSYKRLLIRTVSFIIWGAQFV